MNLLSNAADAIRGSDVGERSLIRVRVESFLDEAERPFIRLCVSDSGPGIAAELVDKVLEPFYTTKAVGVGTGLGMSIVMKIVQAHHGKVSIQNCRELSGAAIVVLLPQRGVDEAEV
ncbi:MAG: ATP-binding protein, partial [Myxococcota bacterium]|nr:ATP-binding protein [Myxococcota bacterium]